MEVIVLLVVALTIHVYVYVYVRRRLSAFCNDFFTDYCYRGSKTFFFASMFYPPSVRESVFRLYAYARLSDDLIDETDGVEREENLSWLLESLDYVTGEREDTPKKNAHPNHPNADLILNEFKKTVTDHHVPKWCIRMLLDGYVIDNNIMSIDTDETLVEYSMCVASSIGLICSHLFEDNPSEETLLHASSLGVAFQFTNIARDIRTDSKIGRKYIPDTWCTSDELSENPLEYSQRLVRCAEPYYDVAWNGIRNLPIAVRPAVACAWALYRTIGTKILQLSQYPTRSFVPTTDKVLISLSTLWNLGFGVRPKVAHRDPEKVFTTINVQLQKLKTSSPILPRPTD